jgi:addiction module HigA family antidote
MNMKMHNPPHPGEVLKALCLEPLQLTVTEAARSIGVSRKTLSAIVNERAGISPEMAIRLSVAFDTSAESWLNQQLQYDLWHAEKAVTREEIDGCLNRRWPSCAQNRTSSRSPTRLHRRGRTPPTNAPCLRKACRVFAPKGLSRKVVGA